MAASNRVKKPLVLKDWAYAWIKDRIIDSTYPPGSLLKIEELSRELEISRTPIREAILRLEQEGLVTTRPRVGSFVTDMNTRDFVELLEIRAVVEGYGVKSIAGSLSNSQLARIETMITECEHEVEEGNQEAFLTHDIDFHSFLMEHAPNPWLATLMRPIKNLRERRLSIAPENLDHVRASLIEHRAILNALREHDGQLASERMKAHLSGIKQRLLKPGKNEDSD